MECESDNLPTKGCTTPSSINRDQICYLPPSSKHYEYRVVSIGPSTENKTTVISRETWPMGFSIFHDCKCIIIFARYQHFWKKTHKYERKISKSFIYALCTIFFLFFFLLLHSLFVHILTFCTKYYKTYKSFTAYQYI